MAKTKVSGETPFQVGASRFCIGQSASGYTLYFSTDGIHFTAWEESTDADTDQVVVNAAAGMYFKLVGNTSDDIPVTW